MSSRLISQISTTPTHPHTHQPTCRLADCVCPVFADPAYLTGDGTMRIGPRLRLVAGGWGTHSIAPKHRRRAGWRPGEPATDRPRVNIGRGERGTRGRCLIPGQPATTRPRCYLVAARQVASCDWLNRVASCDWLNRVASCDWSNRAGAAAPTGQRRTSRRGVLGVLCQITVCSVI